MSIVVPVYTVAAVIGRVLDEVVATTRGWGAEILVVDDGSTDGTASILSARAAPIPGLRLLRHRENRGKGAAIRSALAVATGEVVLVQDADLEYSPRDYLGILRRFEDPDVHAVYGSRFLARAWPDNMAVPNWIANKVFVALTNLLFAAALTDEGTAYKAFRRELIPAHSLTSARFDVCAELTAKLLRRGARIVEVPISYSARTRRDGKKAGFLDGIAVLRALVRYRFMD